MGKISPYSKEDGENYEYGKDLQVLTCGTVGLCSPLLPLSLASAGANNGVANSCKLPLASGTPPPPRRQDLLILMVSF